MRMSPSTKAFCYFGCFRRMEYGEPVLPCEMQGVQVGCNQLTMIDSVIELLFVRVICSLLLILFVFKV
jgi:hypothetical protein